MEDERSRFTCVVWSAARGVDPDLREALQRREVEAIGAAGPHEALARLLAFPGGEGAALVLDEPSRLPDPGRLLDALERANGRCVCWAYSKSAGGPSLAPVTAAERAQWGGQHEPAPPTAAQAPSGSPADSAAEANPRPPRASRDQQSENDEPPNVRFGGSYGVIGRVGPPEREPPPPASPPGLAPEREAAEAGPQRGERPRDERRTDPPPAGSVLTEEELAMLLADDEPEPRDAEEPTGR